MEDPLAVGVRFVLYASLGLLFGVAAFALHALPAAYRREWQRANRPLLLAFAAIAAAASALGLAVLTSRMMGVPIPALDWDAVTTVLSLPGLGMALLLRALALVVLVVAMVAFPSTHILPSAASAVALATLAWFGHAGASEGWMGWLHLASTVMHLLGAGIWAGAILSFLLLARGIREDGAQRLRLSAALGRFHVTGSVIVALLVATGVVNGLLIVRWPPTSQVFGSAWAGLMIWKLGAFAIMLGLAALNRFRLSPQLHGGDSPGPLRRSLAIELALALAILGLVAWLGLLSPIGG